MTQILVTHLTRMRYPYVCVAGIDTRTKRHVRPVLELAQLHRDLTVGPDRFAIGCVMDLGPTTSVENPPHTEDHLFEVRSLRSLKIVPPSELWGVVEARAVPSLTRVFGSQLQFSANGAFQIAGTGRVSLGYLKPERVTLRIDGGRVRATVNIDGRDFDFSVTDRACFIERTQAFAPNGVAVAAINRALSQRQPCVLALGLARPWTARGTTEARCWVQVNGVFLNPTGV